MSNINETLDQRQGSYGSFDVQCKVAQGIKRSMQGSTNWDNLEDYQKEALEMIATKVSRILNGDHLYIESWRDISGYATLVVQTLTETDGATDSRVVKMTVRDGKLVED